jgi:hypothetical protein
MLPAHLRILQTDVAGRIAADHHGAVCQTVVPVRSVDCPHGQPVQAASLTCNATSQ